ncbi:Ferrichrome-iron receptor precursor [bacterium YEK0313]|nr:Ferrichrome-iron receptor precursor [bacterium YEK0313]
MHVGVNDAAEAAKRQRRSGAAWLLATAAAFLPLPAAAQEAASPARSVSVPGGARAYAIGPGTLAQTLNRFAEASGLQLVYSGAVTEGRSSRGLSGTFTRQQALQRLLAGTGLSYRFTTAATVTIERPGAALAAPSDAIALDTIDVQGSGPFGAVSGYVASASSSATRTSTPLVETPQTVSVVTREQLVTTGASSVAEALAYTPGVTSQSPAFSRMADDFMVRGFNVAGGNFGVLRDGLKLQSNVYDGSQEAYGLERIEVLRGAASVLYGQLSPGGLVNAISKRPTTTPLREVQMELGSYGRRQLAADFGGPLTQDGAWSYRLTGLIRDSDNWVHHTPDNRRYIAPALTYSPNASTSFTILGNYQQIRTRFAAPMPAANTLNGQIPRNLFIGEPGYDRYDSDSYMIGYMLDHAFNDTFRLRHSLRYFAADVTWNYLTFGALAANGRTLTRGVSDRTERSTGLTSDTSLEARFQTGPVAHTALIGIDYYRRTYDTHRRQGTVAPLADIYAPVYGAIPVVNYGRDNGSNNRGNQTGIYFQDQMKIADRLIVLAGGRFDWSEANVLSYRPGNAVFSQTDTAFTGRLGLVYVFDNGLAPYASFSQSFTPNVGVGLSRLGTLFKPSRGDQFEVGLRYQPAGTNLMLSAAVYQLTQRNALTPDPVDPTYSVQTGETRSRGFELEARAQYGALGLIAAYSYTDARVTRSNDPREIGERVDVVPYHNLSAWADYDLTAFGLRGLKIGAGARYLSSANIMGYAADVPGRVLVDAMLSYDVGAAYPALKGMEFKVNAWNLLDEKYLTCAGATGCRYGEPRTVRFTLSYRW